MITNIFTFIYNYFLKLFMDFPYVDKGMPVNPKVFGIELKTLPLRKSIWPPVQKPENWFEMLFGAIPHSSPVTRFYYSSVDDGFYSFYIPNYENIYFLPDGLSKIIQVHLNIQTDISSLLLIQESVFVLLVSYSYIIAARVALFWYISINPYINPWRYLVAMVDWCEDSLHGLVPSVLGVNVISVIMIGIIGAIVDALNNLVFTMPYLPSEGLPEKRKILGTFKDVLVFKKLPDLWRTHPIPNELRMEWYFYNPEILKYFQKNYKNLDIQFLPDLDSFENGKKLRKYVKMLNSLDNKLPVDTITEMPNNESITNNMEKISETINEPPLEELEAYFRDFIEKATSTDTNSILENIKLIFVELITIVKLILIELLVHTKYIFS